MAISFQNPPDTPLNFHKFKKNPKNLKPKKMNPKNLKSFWAFLSSIFIYTCIFYAFNLSPSTLFCTTKFWFFISNTLIIIIAADYLSFTSSKTHDYYDEYVDHKSSKITSFDDKIFAKTNLFNRMNEEEKPNEKIINVVDEDKSEILLIEENDPEQGPGEKKEEDEHEITRIKEKDRVDPDPEEEPGKISVRKCGRSNSDVVAWEGEGKVVLQRTFSERHNINEENEFSRMSDEELNGRVEEFIRRFNRQIRLQALTNSTN